LPSDETLDAGGLLEVVTNIRTAAVLRISCPQHKPRRRRRRRNFLQAPAVAPIHFLQPTIHCQSPLSARQPLSPRDRIGFSRRRRFRGLVCRRALRPAALSGHFQQPSPRQTCQRNFGVETEASFDHGMDCAGVGVAAYCGDGYFKSRKRACPAFEFNSLASSVPS
jgi:hypothetical protein